ncbi:glyoxalase [Wenyingzhuangia sp. chi5]|uniref:Glyoxalase n=1 Tax=Wenyingzhuangia gilva TaxID=3057677 RepID=A0ABT8VUY6_9FLAO|nr:glyoxalase [Wenyingzhuangia sp. chi5]MDO3695783.1 glyoxalase [Wenyingzhuangia sp. chi5]
MESKTSIRPNIPSAKVNETMSAEEQFQNAVLRPIIKMQYNLIIALFDNYLQHADFNLKSLEVYQKNEFLKTAVTRNQHLRNQYVGMVIGMFTDEEFTLYLNNASEYSRRIIQMISQRLQDTY